MRSAGFRHLASAVWINELGNSIGEVALALLVYDRTGSPLASAGLFLALRFLPALVGPLIAVYVEAFPARVALACIYVLEACVFAGIAFVATSFSLPVVLALVAVDGALAIVATALTRSATAHDLMGSDLLRQGNSLLNVGAMIAFACGPIVAGEVIAWRGVAVALVADATTFLLTAFVVATAREVRIDTSSSSRFSGRLRAAAAVLKHRHGLRRLLIATTLTFGVSSIAVPVEVVFAKTTLHAGSTGYGLLLTSWGVGMIIGSAVFALGHRLALMLVLGFSTALVVAGYAGLSVSPTLAFACGFSVLGGTGNGAAWIAAMTAIQERTPLESQTSVMSLLYALNQVVPALGFVAGGLITTLLSARAAYGASAIGTALALGFFLIRPIGSATSDGSGAARDVVDEVEDRPSQQAAMLAGRNPKAAVVIT